MKSTTNNTLTGFPIKLSFTLNTKHLITTINFVNRDKTLRTIFTLFSDKLGGVNIGLVTLMRRIKNRKTMLTNQSLT